MMLHRNTLKLIPNGFNIQVGGRGIVMGSMHEDGDQRPIHPKRNMHRHQGTSALRMSRGSNLRVSRMPRPCGRGNRGNFQGRGNAQTEGVRHADMNVTAKRAEWLPNTRHSTAQQYCDALTFPIKMANTSSLGVELVGAQ